MAGQVPADSDRPVLPESSSSSGAFSRGKHLPPGSSVTGEDSNASSRAIMVLDSVERTYASGSTSVQALRGIDLILHPATLVVVRGKSGSGKTTMLNLMGGLDKPTAGRVLFGGRDIGGFSDSELTVWRRGEVGFVFQSFALLHNLTAFENVEIALHIAGVKPSLRTARVRECLEMVGLTKRARHRILELSGGEQQRVGIARAIANRPSLVLADEPTGEVDHETGLKIMSLFQDIVRNEKVTVCVATHDPSSAEFADTRYFIRDGLIHVDDESSWQEPAVKIPRI